eukprot:c2897_g1_i1.p2 GENE.c2897_g1_i1~~c2897_g1_i1.p2  ORF type:complete len:256 (+),score=32.49 c2897_g1_i1:2-769(+)
MRAIVAAFNALSQGHGSAADLAVTAALAAIRESCAVIRQAFSTMSERCLPEAFYHRIRHYLNGWTSDGGLVYRGVGPAAGDETLAFVGGSGAQSPLLQVIDAALGIDHQSAYLRGIRAYMPPRHREFLERIAALDSLRAHVLAHGGAALTQAFNETVDVVTELRSMHLRAVCRYVTLQGRNPVGTGGTEVMPFLRGIRDSTRTGVVPARCPFSGAAASSADGGESATGGVRASAQRAAMALVQAVGFLVCRRMRV